MASRKTQVARTKDVRDNAYELGSNVRRKAQAAGQSVRDGAIVTKAAFTGFFAGLLGKA